MLLRESTLNSASLMGQDDVSVRGVAPQVSVFVSLALPNVLN
jgi:hypothetical protein